MAFSFVRKYSKYYLTQVIINAIFYQAQGRGQQMNEWKEVKLVECKNQEVSAWIVVGCLVVAFFVILISILVGGAHAI
jgi:hypothetical protein